MATVYQKELSLKYINTFLPTHIFSTKKQATTLHVVISTWQLSTSISYIYAFPVWSVASSSNRCCKVSTSALWDVWARRKRRSSGLRSSQQRHEQNTGINQWFMQLALEQKNTLKHCPSFFFFGGGKVQWNQGQIEMFFVSDAIFAMPKQQNVGVWWVHACGLASEQHVAPRFKKT